MTERDTFLVEVAEEVRRDRMFRLWRRYGPYAIGAIVVIVAGLAARDWMARDAEQKARAQMEAFLAVTANEGSSETAGALESLAAESDSGYALIARFRAASEWLKAGDSARARELYRGIAVEEGIQPVYRELAELKAVMANSENMSAEELVAALRPLALESRIYGLVAREFLAGALLVAGDAAGSLELLHNLLETPELSAQMGARLRAMREVARAQTVEFGQGEGS